MKSRAWKVAALFVFALLCTVAFSTTAMAKAHIKFSVEHVHMHQAGEVEVVGYFENDGDKGAYVKWMDLDLTLIADNGQQMWANKGIRHYVDDIYVPAGQYVAYTYYIHNPDIPEYHGKHRSRWHSRAHYEKAAG